MEPITFGMVAIGMTGGSLAAVTILKRVGFGINEDAIRFVLEITKYGGMLYLLQHLSNLFF